MSGANVEASPKWLGPAIVGTGIVVLAIALVWLYLAA